MYNSGGFAEACQRAIIERRPAERVRDAAERVDNITHYLDVNTTYMHVDEHLLSES